ncbi:2-oxoglutarate synthase subunit, 2-oxoacid-ferredoxin oxidoreductase subunit B [Cyanobium sp. Copco_Reservoir_LC18]|uniref:2-succinyl-5-enolpyruvyl-6-hydroxy-3- cyclohexene-1-carboxylic-acid synthase n=1 Tax=Cyanobium sp. Copco_Reservoir_LC18 TaxID=1328305 RepID=UPI00135C5382|nr:2-succinyl-5-enolpyruvyl-6-hydroxy-3-cyclohexene-1-carboxylic-acid synthase [Cyanobium sp. Copco_Reservoir_LC18]KAF0654033.1 2-oxoglutarate synthase subunit, 2-oxoacid-ferredoxin oxidoreductase subunit B [Cyanobium sp. Copco_Reservoir_LC18]
MAGSPTSLANVRAALTLLGALRRGGLTHGVLCPGSRSAPLAVAAALLEPGGLRLHTAIDERSAAFFALGLGRASGQPAAVITTSGTAVANLLPAAVEADFGSVPLLLLTADRPARLKGCGANQSVNQEVFLAGSCRWLGEGDPQGLAAMEPAGLADLARQALAAARGDGAGRSAGPVHLNLPFDEPLHADGADLSRLAAALADAPSPPATEAPATAAPGHPVSQASAGTALDPDRPGVVVAGPWRGAPAAWPAHVEALRRWQRRSGWPVLADALSGLRGLPDLETVTAYDLMLPEASGGDGLAPGGDRQVLRLGPLPASRRLQRWLAAQGGPQVLVSEGDGRRLDPLGVVRGQASAGLAAWLAEQPPASGAGEASGASLALANGWRRAEAAVQALLERELAGEQGEPALARHLSRLLPAGLPLMLANSSPVRDWESFADPAAPPRPMHGFRGASGIDGTLSSACGLAEALGALVLVSGDLALLHDANGWLWRPQLGGRLTVVLIDNGGGGIFEQLPIRTQPAAALDFERLFAMPQPVDPLALAAVHGVPGRRLEHLDDLEGALAWALAQPLALLVVPTDRRRDAALRQRLRTMAADLADPLATNGPIPSP